MKNPNPQCPKDDCLFIQDGPSFTTAMYCNPVYDKHGNMVSKDYNISTCDVKCLKCEKRWISRTQAGETTYEEVPNDPNAV